MNIAIPISLLGLVASCVGSDAGEPVGGQATQVSEDDDGDGWTVDDGDCDDSTGVIYPGAPEVCDGRDNDCDGLVDYDDPDRQQMGFEDADGDGYEAQPFGACNEDDFVEPEDCDDEDAGVNPGAAESCATDADDDCDGDHNDEGAEGCTTWYADRDEDGYGGIESACLCESAEPFTALEPVDCDDSDPARYPGTADGCVPWWGNVSTDAADATLLGEHEYGYLGSVVAAAGDMNADGVDDVAIAAINDPGAGAFEDGGAVYLMLGPWADERQASDADITILSEHDSSLGVSLASVGDMNGDGFDDLLVGDPEVEVDGALIVGGAWLVLGPLSGKAAVSDVAHRFTGPPGDIGGLHGVAAAGDADGDGVADVIVGGRGTAVDGEDGWGAVYLVSGPVLGDVDLANTAARFTPEERSYAGVVAGGGDFDGDGIADVAVGAPSHLAGHSLPDTGWGAVFLLLGPFSGEVSLDSAATATWTGDEKGQFFGTAVALAGDTDGDGLDEVVVGSIWDKPGPGAHGSAWLVDADSPGTFESSEARAWFHDDGSAQWLGFAMDGAADVDDDGFDDLLIGAPWGNRAFLVYGPVSGSHDAGELPVEFEGAAATDEFGYGVAFAGDIDDNGTIDVLAGGDGGRGELYGTGMAHLLLNSP